MIFSELVRQGRATAVADQIGLGQSAVSHALSRLRRIFNDELFVRRSDGLDPTPRALELAPMIENAITIIATAVASTRQFDPTNSGRLFRVGASDYVGTLVAAPLIKEVAQYAAGARVSVRLNVGVESIDALNRGEIDVALGHLTSAPDQLFISPLFEERLVVVARRANPITKGSLSPKTFADADHLIVSVRGALPVGSTLR
jgi:LysR family transcriptional regulator, mexEF-oprN operon transcriptional activator